MFTRFAFASQIQASSDDLPLDLNHDRVVDIKDHAHWVTDIKQTWIGDANLDGEFNSGELVDVFEAGEYETGEAVGWSQGDWNADGVFDSSDFTRPFRMRGTKWEHASQWLPYRNRRVSFC